MRKDRINNILKKLPSSAGVYFYKDKTGLIIYVGKATNLKNRVKQYFQKSRHFDPKTQLLIKDIADIEWQQTSGEAEALFLEAELIKRYQPKYNILLRDDKSSVYIRINIKDFAPSVTLTRRPSDDQAEYFGPYLAAWQVRRALKYLRKAFPFSTHITLPKRACLDVHLGLCPGPETATYNRQEYLANLRHLMGYIKGSNKSLAKIFKKKMLECASQQRFEDAARMRNRLASLNALQNQVIFGDRESLDISKDYSLNEIKQLLGLKEIPKRIESYDISHTQGVGAVASMVVFVNGLAEKPAYRKFQMNLPGNNDVAHIKETLTRRFSSNNKKKWPRPNLIIIDGGKGQLKGALEALAASNIKIPTIGLAKRQEEIVVNNFASNTQLDFEKIKNLKPVVTKLGNYTTIKLPMNSNSIKLMQRIRDEAHRFALSYHSVIRQRGLTSSLLDEIVGIGPITRKKLLKRYGSIKKIKLANYQELASLVGQHKAKLIRASLKKDSPISSAR